MSDGNTQSKCESGEVFLQTVFYRVTPDLLGSKTGNSKGEKINPQANNLKEEEQEESIYKHTDFSPSSGSDEERSESEK